MRHLTTLVFLLLSVVSVVRADLTCLGWAAFSPIVGLICFFEPKVYKEAEKVVVEEVTSAAKSLEAVAKFDITHNPIAVTYNYGQIASTQGIGAVNNFLGTIARDEANVTIGFAKETVNQVVQLYDLTHWQDVSYCLMRGATKLAVASAKKRRRSNVPSAADVGKMAAGCVYTKLTKPPVFNITVPEQKVGATISDLAAFLVPVGAEEKAVATAADAGFDLAIAGSEDSTRIFKKLPGGNTAAHFASEEEAEAVAKELEDPKWAQENCGVCPPPTGALVARGYLIGRGPGLSKVFGGCCGVPSVRVPPSEGFDVPAVESESDAGSVAGESADAPPAAAPERGLPVFDPAGQAFLEADLSPPPKFAAHDVAIPSSTDILRTDIEQFSTGVVKWSPDMSKVLTSKQFFPKLRALFTGPAEDPLYQALEITERNGKLRMTTFSRDWINSRNPVLKEMQDFTNAAVQHGIDIVTNLKKFPNSEGLTGNVEFFYTAPSEEALAGVDPRGFHSDRGLVQLAAADTPGLCIANSNARTASRVALQPDTMYVMKSNGWDIDAWLYNRPGGPTFHSVFGPEMAKNGRISMVMSIFFQGTHI